MARLHCLLVLAIVGCADLTAPPGYSGSYDLARVNGLDIPVAVPGGTPGCTTVVHGARLELSTGAFSITLMTGAQCAGDVGIGIGGLSGSVRATGHVLELTSHQAPPAVSENTRLSAVWRGQDVDLTWLDAGFGVPDGTHFTFARSPSP